MPSRALIPALILCCAAAMSASASIATLHVDSGEVKIWNSSWSLWSAVKDSMAISSGDSIQTAERAHAVIMVGAETSVKLRGQTSVLLTARDSGVVVNLLRGQLFLYRLQNEKTTAIMMLSGDCRFIPVGTAAALRTGRNGEPIVAVLQGRIRAETPDGRSFEVLPGMQGSFDPVGMTFKVAELPAQAIAQLEQWSGAALEKPAAEPPAAQPVAEAAQTPAEPAAQPPQPMAVQPAPAPAQPAAAAPAKPAAADSAPKPALAPQSAPVQQAQAQPPAQPTAQPLAQQQQQQPLDTTAGKKPPEPQPGDQKAEGGTEKPKFEIAAGTVTVDDKQWTRIAFGVDVPIWKFGVFFDLELFVDSAGRFSNKGWVFDKDNWAPSLTRKIRYLRFGHENEPLFVKIGGLQGVTFGYGFVVDRFTNMLHYPDQKLLGVQFYLNDISPIGLTLQTMTPDVMDFGNTGGVLAARLGVKPLKFTEIPILKGLMVAGTYGWDRNQYAPARKWDLTLSGPSMDRDEDGIPDSAFILGIFNNANVVLPAAGRDSLIAKGQYDTIVEHRDAWATRTTDAYSVVGGDVSVPLIETTVLNLTVYGQAGLSYDYDNDSTAKPRGWGIGAPGVQLNVGPLGARVEYRHINGRFEPGYFGPYYLDERLVRYGYNPSYRDSVGPQTRASRLQAEDLNGVFGTAGLNIADAITITATYQFLMGKNDASDQRYEATAGLGDLIVKKIPKLSKVEAYVYKSDIGRSRVYDKKGKLVRSQDLFFDITPYFYFGYRLGVSITEGAALIWDARYGYKYDANNRRVSNNNVSIQTAITF